MTERLINCYRNEQRGDTGLVFVEIANPIYLGGKYLARQLNIRNDKYIPGFKKLTDAVHAYARKQWENPFKKEGSGS